MINVQIVSTLSMVARIIQYTNKQSKNKRVNFKKSFVTGCFCSLHFRSFGFEKSIELTKLLAWTLPLFSAFLHSHNKALTQGKQKMYNLSMKRQNYINSNKVDVPVVPMKQGASNAKSLAFELQRAHILINICLHL